MEAWYNDNLTGNELVLLSETGYSNGELAMYFLEHFIRHTKATADGPKRVILMDSHTSYTNPELAIRADQVNIILYTFPSHLTHALQPLDVAVFQPYKHWHKVAIQHAMRSLDLDYNIASFFRDLTEIRQNTFKKGTILKAFRESGMWPINSKEALKKMKIYNPPEKPVQPAVLPRTPTKFTEVEQQLQFWKEKLPELLSSGAGQKWDSFVRGTEQVVVGGLLVVLQLDLLSNRVAEQQKAKVRSRKVVQRNSGPLTATEARQCIAEKDTKVRVAKEQSLRYKSRVQLNKVKSKYYTLGVAARKAERQRNQQNQLILKEKGEIPIELQLPIRDPSKEVTEEQLILEANEAMISLTGQLGVYESVAKSELQAKKEGEEDGEADFMAFGEDGSEFDCAESDADEIDFGLYN
jgi:hypothetical protein